MRIEYNTTMVNGYKYKRIAETLRQKIKNGGYQEGTLLPTSKLLADEYQTTPVTIDRAIGLLVKDQLVNRTPGVGTTVLSSKSSIGMQKSGKSQLIGILLQAQTDSRYWERLLEGVQDVLQPKGFFPIIGYHNQDANTALDYIKMFSDQGVSVILFAPFDRPDVQRYEADNAVVIEAMRSLDIHMIMIDRHLESVPGHFVSEYCYSFGIQMFERLFDLGYRKPLCFTTDYVSVIGDRERAFVEGNLKNGIHDLQDRIVRIPLKTYQEKKYQEILDILYAHDDFDIIICMNSRIFNTILYVLAKYAIGLDTKRIKLAGFVDIELIDMENVVAYVEQPVREMGKAAGRMICALLDEPSPEYRHALVPCELRFP